MINKKFNKLLEEKKTSQSLQKMIYDHIHSKINLTEKQVEIVLKKRNELEKLEREEL